MKNHFFLNISQIIRLIIGLALLVFLDLSFTVPAEAKGVKTSYKRYSIFKFKNGDVLCEPYTVTKDDWLYKIFRKKGEISEKDFPHFLIIFKELNPEISNIDAIEPGISILIPLKKVEKKDYDLSTPDDVDVPVIEFSTLPEDTALAPYIKKHTIKRGENISSLVDKEFLQKSGRLSEEGLKAFQLANPNIQNINIIYEGADIYLPDASIKSQPWFQSFISEKPQQDDTKENGQILSPSSEPSGLDALKLLQLKKYTSLIGGTLLSQGKMYFPGKNGSNQVLDLSNAPVIETEDGTKILIISGENQNDMLLERVQEYWKDLRIQMMSEAIEEFKTAARMKTTQKSNQIAPNPTIAYKKRVKHLLSQTEYDYIPDAKIPFTLNNIQLEASFGRIIREEKTDLLINFGNVYGKALEVLEKKEFKIISITPNLTDMELSKILFSNLGYTTWENPSFYTGEKVESIAGLYAVKEKKKLFVPEKLLSITAMNYLKKEEIKIISLSPDTLLNQ
ncbi:MAG: hypothetical protein ABIJ59_14690 [Pseudomonadota bacterium]